MNEKVAATVASTTLGAWLLDKWHLVSAELPDVSAAAALILIVVMIISHTCDTVRKNSEHKRKAILDELLIEKQRRELERDTDE